jgi:hypothetical protein
MMLARIVLPSSMLLAGLISACTFYTDCPAPRTIIVNAGGSAGSAASAGSGGGSGEGAELGLGGEGTAGTAGQLGEGGAQAE